MEAFAVPSIDGFVPAPKADIVPCADCLKPSHPAQYVDAFFGPYWCLYMANSARKSYLRIKVMTPALC